MIRTEPVIKVGLATPVMHLFDYLPPAGERQPVPGQRVRVPFGRATRIGVVVDVVSHSDVPPRKLRRIEHALDSGALLDAHVLALCAWASRYYQHPPGEVLAAALPGKLRRGEPLAGVTTRWRLTPAGRDVDVGALARRAPRQAELLALAQQRQTLGEDCLAALGRPARDAARALTGKGWLETRTEPEVMRIETGGHRDIAPQPSEAQAAAVTAINAAEGFRPFLLEGVTGSGKTEVYLRCVERVLEQGRQALVLVPEIGLTPQLVERFRRRLDAPVGVIHSGLNDTERLRAWCGSRDGSVAVVIGTRSAVFTPLARPGLIIVDEEHDASLKQQDGFRYSARDLAVWRARKLQRPVILGSATPSFESLENAAAGRYTLLTLPERAGPARPPEISVIDLRRHGMRDGLSEPLIAAVRRHLDGGGQVLLYLNRRGFAPVLMCSGCGRIADCRRCDARMVVHRRRARMICHHCGAEQALPSNCADCGEALQTIGQGTERIESALGAIFPDHDVVRIDRDTTRRRGEIERRLERIRQGEASLLLGTQMLTKGHDFPGVTLVGILDADQGLFGTDYRSSERLAQSFVQVAGRAGRADRPGEVLIQSWFPDHPMLKLLVAEGYDRFAARAMRERRQAGWPPYGCMALLRAEATERHRLFEFLDEARRCANRLAGAGIRILGPAPAPMERRSGKFRGQLLIRSDRRAIIQPFLAEWRRRLDEVKSGRKARWSLDVDPVELF